MTESGGRKAANRGLRTQEYFIKMVNENRDFNKRLKDAIGVRQGCVTAKEPPTTS